MRNRIAARRLDLDLAAECKRMVPIVLEAAETRTKDPRGYPSTNSDTISAAIAMIDGEVLDMVYPMITALCLLRSASTKSISSDKEIRRLLQLAGEIVTKVTDLELVPEIRKSAEARHSRFKDAVAINASFGFYCVMSMAHSKAKHYPFKLFNEAIAESLSNIILVMPLGEQKEVFKRLGYDDERIAALYLMKAVQLQNDTAHDLMRVGVVNSLQQFAAFVSKGNELGVFAGWAKTDRNEARRDICPNLDNPVVVKVLREANGKIPESN